VALFGLALLLAGNWALPLIDRDEPRFAEASREMRQSGDWILPRFNGNYRFDKPPFIYWCQAACYGALGENVFAARLPSAMFATVTALLLLFWGRRLGQPRAGFHASIMFLTSLAVLIWGRLSVADMPMIFFFTLAVWSGWEVTRPSARPHWHWFFYASLALGFQAKGPEAWLPLLGLWICRWRRPDNFRLSAKPMLLGIVFTSALVAVWAAPALIQTHGDFFRVGIGRHVIHRSFDPMEGHGFGGWLYFALLPFFFVTFFASFFPWSIWFPVALRNGPGNDFEKYLLTQAAIVFVVFTLLATKLLHYTLPAFPCLALWLALRRGSEPLAPRRLVLGAAAMACLVCLAAAAFPFAGSRMIAANLWRALHSQIQPGTRVAAVEFAEPSIVWECRRATTNHIEFIDVAQAADFLRGAPPRCLILPTKDWNASQFNAPTNAIAVHAAGIDTASFHQWDLTAVVRP